MKKRLLFRWFFPALVSSGVICSSLIICSISSVHGHDSGFNILLAALRKEASDRGISQKTVNAALTGLEPISEVIERDRNQPESKLALNEYLSRIISEERVTKGRMKLGENSDLLAQINERYGVQPSVLVALWGIETDFGRGTGNFPVIDSLATLVYDGRRSSLFKKELIHALRILDEGHIPLEQMKGSWAGAMGQLQFMPSTYHRSAVDFDGDGRKDIWTSVGDSFASADNYLSQSGWKSGQRWGQEVYLPDSFVTKSIGLKHRKPISGWQALGIRSLDDQNFPASDLLSSIIQPYEPAGRAFLVYSNYRVILKWNRSHNFAIAVGILSDLIGRS
jgi:membrane-bound lytic murein transglycosylase B